MNKILLTTQELAARINRHPETVHRLRRKGKLSFVLINRTPMFREEDVAAFLAANEVKPQASASKASEPKGGAA